MNPKGGSSGESGGGGGGASGGNGVSKANHSDGEEMMMEEDESGISDDDEDDDEEHLMANAKANSKAKANANNSAKANNKEEEEGVRKGRVGGGGGHEDDEEGDGDEDTSDDEDDDDDDDDDEEEEEEGEDSSDMDVQECERKRFEYIDDLTDLEKQFAILNEQLYRERMTQIEAKLAEVKSGKASEYLQPLEELQVNMKNRLEVGAVLRELRLANIQCKHDAEMLATEQNFLSEKELLWDSIKADLEEKIHMLEEDKHNVDFSSGLWEQSSGKSRKRKADALDPDRRKKPVTVTGPYIVYMLREGDIIDDWTIIKKAITQRKKT